MSPSSHTGKINLAKRAYTLILAAFLGLFCTCSFAGFEDRTFEKERLQMGDEIEEIFIKYGICKEKRKVCEGKEEFFASPLSGGFYIATYGVTSMKIINEIISKVVELYDKNRRIRIEMYCYSITKKDSMAKFFGIDTPFLKLELKREQ
ncbi:MAG: hypothetical protein LBU76_08535 [Azoarcus sp.]|jgi:hypothetical protein|nr:hypothetical protein [Azoarcus sp.]